MSGEWLADPSQRFEFRYWDGVAWTEHVASGGEQFVDPPDTEARGAPPVSPPAGWLADPTGRQLYRWWDGSTWTVWVANGGEPFAEAGVDLPHGPRTAVAGQYVGAPASLGTQARQVAERMTGGQGKALGDRVVHTLGVATLSNWANRRLAEALFIPQLTAAVQERPTDPIRRLHLGLRLLEMKVANDRIRRGQGYYSLSQVATRPVSRVVGRTVTRALKSDNTPAHQRVLQPLHHQLVQSVRAGRRDVAALNALARIYRASSYRPKALEVIEAAKLADPSCADTYYIGAEILLDGGGQEAAALRWAAEAHARGSEMATAILQPDGLKLRAKYLAPRVGKVKGYDADRYLGAMRAYYAPVPTNALDRFIGPSAVTAWRNDG